MKNEKTVFVVYTGVKIDKSKERPVRRQIEVRPFNDELKYLQGLVDGYLEHLGIRWISRLRMLSACITDGTQGGIMPRSSPQQSMPVDRSRAGSFRRAPCSQKLL